MINICSQLIDWGVTIGFDLIFSSKKNNSSIELGTTFFFFRIEKNTLSNTFLSLVQEKDCKHVSHNGYNDIYLSKEHYCCECQLVDDPKLLTVQIDCNTQNEQLSRVSKKSAFSRLFKINNSIKIK